MATYAANIVGAATSSGSTENPMLKAQMLATALNVHFSDPTLGGDKVSGYNGGITIVLGGVTISLTSASPENVSAAFGEATNLTVMNMLLFANSPWTPDGAVTTVSNAGGSVWYDQIKATQDLAQTIFNAINNDAAPIYP
ncbi:MAG: hypothetical protein ABSH56_35955 [Bryobacteraceae bacterium]